MKGGTLALFIGAVVLSDPARAEERHMMYPRVPAERMAEARALKNPLPHSPEIVEKARRSILRTAHAQIACSSLQEDLPLPISVAMRSATQSIGFMPSPGM